MTDTTSSYPETQAYPHPSAILQSIWWVGRGGWGALPILTADPDCNIYLLHGQDFDVLIDCGMGTDLTRLEQHILAAGSTPRRIHELWCTHSHYDHFMRAVHWVTRYPHVICRIAATAITFLQQGNYRLVSHTVADQLVAVPVPAQLVPLQHGMSLTCPPWTFQAVGLPGHVPDQIGFRGLVDGLDVLFSGDAALGDQNGIPGMIGWLDGLWLSDLGAYRRTLASLAAHPPALLLPGHGRPHAGVDAAHSLQHCQERIERFAAFPDLAYMMPIAYPPDAHTGEGKEHSVEK